MQNPIATEGVVSRAFAQAFGTEEGVTVQMELTRAIRDEEFPAAILTFQSSDIRPRVAGEDPKFASVSGNRYVHRYFLDISVKNAALSRLMALVDKALGAADIFNAANAGIIMVFDGFDGIERTEDMRDDIRSIRLRVRCETT